MTRIADTPVRRLVFVLTIVASQTLVSGQGQTGQAPAGPPPTPRASAPIELTGNWVSIVTEDWRWRMVPPPKGDYASVPITPEAKRIADGWDPAKDQAAGFTGGWLDTAPGAR